MKKPLKITSKSILKIDKYGLTFGETFHRVLNNFIAAQTRPFSFLETIILSCVLIEAIIKEQLKKINPTLILDKIEPEAIALVSGKVKELLNEPSNQISDIHTAKITELISRLSKFQDISKYQGGLKEFFELRNKIVHSADDIQLQENQTSIILTKYVFPFIQNYVDANPQIWQDMEKIAKVAHDQYRRNLVKLIVQYRRVISTLDKADIEKLINSSTSDKLGKDEEPRNSELICPGCLYPLMILADGVDYDYEDGEVTYSGYTFAICKMCNLRLDKVELDEIIENPEFYFSPTKEQILEWRVALNEPDYLYDYYD